MNYWTIQHPPDSFLAEHVDAIDTLSLPGIECKTCGESWSGARLLPFKANNQIQDIIRQTKRILPRPAFIELKNRIAQALKLNEEQSSLLDPGSSFPSVLINTKGLTPVCYSGQRTFLRKDVIDKLRPLIGSQLNITEAAHWEAPPSKSQLYCIEPKLDSDLPKGMEISSKCTDCGFIHYRKTSDKLQYHPTCHAKLENSIIPLHFFRLKPTSLLLFSDEVQSVIEGFNPQDTQFIAATEIDLSDIATD